MRSPGLIGHIECLDGPVGIERIDRGMDALIAQRTAAPARSAVCTHGRYMTAERGQIES